MSDSLGNTKLSIRRRDDAPLTCLICRDNFPDPADCFQCTRCGTPVHRECAADGQCQVLGCIGKIPLDGTTKNEEFKTSTAWPAYESCLALLLILAIPVAVISALLRFNENWTLTSLYALAFINFAIWAFYNLTQSLLLMNPIRNREDLPSTHRKLAIHGPVDIGGQELLDPNGKPCIYYKIEQQHYENGRHPGWHTDSTEEFALPFRILGVLVSNNPSEIYGIEEWTSTEDKRDGKRIHIETLPLDKEITALGLFEYDPQNPKLINDNGIGLTFTSLSPYESAKQELNKAIGQFLIAAFLGFLLWKELKPHFN